MKGGVVRAETISTCSIQARVKQMVDKAVEAHALVRGNINKPEVHSISSGYYRDRFEFSSPF